MFTGLCGGLLMAAVLIVIDVLRTRKLLLKMDLSEVLVNAQNKLDDPIRERLSDGTILLLRTDWLMSPASDAQLGKDPLTGKPIIKRRQEMPPEAYFSPAASVELFSSGKRSVLVLSYGWATGPHSDPSGHTLEMVRRYLRSDQTTKGCALFWDVLSVPALANHAHDRGTASKSAASAAPFQMSRPRMSVLTFLPSCVFACSAALSLFW